MDVSEYRPEELKVTTVNNTLAIEGKHEDRKSDEKNTANSTASGSSQVMRQFSRKRCRLQLNPIKERLELSKLYILGALENEIYRLPGLPILIPTGCLSIDCSFHFEYGCDTISS